MSIEEDIERLNSIVKVNKDFLYDIENQTINQKEIKALEHLLQDYTRQKQINEEHKRLNGELRKKVKELEEKNKHLSNTSDYETISLECTNLEEQLEIANNRIQELEEENYVRKIQIYEKSIAKEKVINVIQEYKDKIERYKEYRIQGKETDVEYYENIANTIIVQVLQELLETK